ncbi:hypothetical protein D9758_005008 [Tetrapyrgos nigripes]|uniref:Uncharacterized protein n=1 Tax=Tetrapyrgos nigripes TaxID=182062 RepID=A0A8H5GWF1_9AGAR|nr:hypothetical protein D9758_005008 [Tetrapyrgos nigripes]
MSEGRITLPSSVALALTSISGSRSSSRSKESFSSRTSHTLSLPKGEKPATAPDTYPPSINASSGITTTDIHLNGIMSISSSIRLTSSGENKISFSLSRYRHRWFLVFSDYYEILDPPSARIYRVLNGPKAGPRTPVEQENSKRFFWFNPTIPVPNATKIYNFSTAIRTTIRSSSSPSLSRSLSSSSLHSGIPDSTPKNSNRILKSKDTPDPLASIRMLLDAFPPVIRMTGRMRAEPSEAWGVDEGAQTISYEMEVLPLVQEEGLLRQCYWCLEWEGAGHRVRAVEAESGAQRFKRCGDDLYWCARCASNGWLSLTMSSTFGKLTSRGRDSDEWRKRGRQNIYLED